MTAGAAILATVLALALGPAAAAAHHVGTYTARDDEVSATFKQLKFTIQARKFDVALRIFEGSALRREMAARAARLPAGLEASTRAALKAGDPAAAEQGLIVFLAALSRDLALDADRVVADATTDAEARAAAGRKFLEAIWRYYNLIDFAVSQRDAKSAVAIRLAFEEAEAAVKGTAAPAALNPCSGAKGAPGRGATAPNPTGMREPLQRIAQILSRVIEASTTSTRRQS